MIDMPVLDEAGDPASSSFHALLRSLWDQHNKDLRELREKLQPDSIITSSIRPDVKVSTDAMDLQSKHEDDRGEIGVAAPKSLMTHTGRTDSNSLTTHAAMTDSQKLRDGGAVSRKSIKDSVSTNAMDLQIKHEDDQREIGVAAPNSLTTHAGRTGSNSRKTHLKRTDSQKVRDGGVVSKKTLQDSVSEHAERFVSQIFKLELDHAEGKLGHLTLYQRLQLFLQSNFFESAVTLLLTLNVVFMATESQIRGCRNGYALEYYAVKWPDDAAWPGVESALRTMDTAFTIVFLLDTILRIVVLRLKFWCVFMNYIDFIVVVTSVMAFFADEESLDLVMLRLLRLGKLARAMRMITMSKVLESLKLLLKCISASVTMLFWSFCLLTFIQSLAGMVISALARDYMEDVNGDKDVQREVFEFYGTFARTFLTMNEVLFANWAPACRVLVNNINENFMFLFLAYRCVVGFAVLNVVNSVFVQQTMKIANSDEDMAFLAKQKEKSKYSQRLKKLFQAVDESGDGYVSSDEFAILLESPKMRFWMERLELDYHDMMGLFELLDDGDGLISLDEFANGALRLKGSAKSVDVWRLETKLEVLFKQVLHLNSKMTSELGNVKIILAKSGKREHLTAAYC